MNNNKNTSQKLNVLIVDDNEDMCKVISSIMQVKGCDTYTARTSEAALNFIKTSMPDMVCCDIRLNGRRAGLDLARIVRGDKETDHLFLIAVSAYCSEKEKEEALHAGFDMFFPKPVRFSDMTRAIEIYFAARNLARNASDSPFGC